jgi:hypothetical protein
MLPLRARSCYQVFRVNPVSLRIESDPQLVYIADSHTPIYGNNKCTTILVTSPLLARTKSTRSRMQARHHHHADFAAEAEVALMHEHCFPNVSDELLRKRLAIWGGIPRHLFMSETTVDQDLATVSALVNTLKPQDVLNQSMLSVLELAANMPHKIFHVQNRGHVERLSPSNPHFYEFFIRSLSTEVVEGLARTAWARFRRSQLAELVKYSEDMPESSTLRGIFHEIHGCKVLKRGGEFSTRSLTFPSLAKAQGACHLHHQSPPSRLNPRTV